MPINNAGDTKDGGRMEENVAKGKRRINKNVFKIMFLIYHGIVILCFSAAIALLMIPDAKLKLLASPLGRFLVKTQVSEEEFENVRDTDFEKDKVVINDEINTELMQNYTNIALFGLDSRDQSLDRTNSDTIMIVSIDKKSKEVKLVSVYRDTYQQIYKDGEVIRYGKINSAYASGGPEAAVNTLNQNLDLDIQDYMAVNFNGIATIIDLLGGVDLHITEHERDYINGYLTETRKITGLDAPDVTKVGDVHLNGLQATAYCRIRYTAVYLEDGTSYNNDFGRTARQRLILSKLVEKAKKAGISEVMGLCEEVFKAENSFFRTSLTYDEVLELLPVVLNFSLESNVGFPFTYDADVKINKASCIGVAGQSYNVAKLHEYLFQDDSYTPSKKVAEIDKKLLNLTGVYTMLLEEDRENAYDKYKKYLKQTYVPEYFGDDEDDDDEDEYRGDEDDNDYEEEIEETTVKKTEGVTHETETTTGDMAQKETGETGETQETSKEGSQETQEESSTTVSEEESSVTQQETTTQNNSTEHSTVGEMNDEQKKQ